MTLMYHTFSEFVGEAKANNNGCMASSKQGDPKFYGDAPDFATAVARCYDGYNAKEVGGKRRTLSDMLDLSKPLDTMKNCGEALDVPTYLSGEMRCWWAPDEETPRPPKCIHMHVSGVNPWWVSPEQFANHGGAVAVLADALQATGAKVKISIGYALGQCQWGNGFFAVELKGYGEEVDVPRIGASTHASFFRRIGFTHIENVHPNFDGHSSSYGMAMANERRAQVISNDDVCNWLRIESDEIVLDVPNAESSVFKDTTSTAEWVERQLEIINNNTTNHIQIQ